MKTKLSALELHEILLENILDKEGKIYFNMAGICFKIKETDTVGKTL